MKASDLTRPDGLLDQARVWLRPCSCVVVVTFDPDRIDLHRTKYPDLREQAWTVDEVRRARLSCPKCRPDGVPCPSKQCRGHLDVLARGANDSGVAVTVAQCNRCGRIVEDAVAVEQDALFTGGDT